MTGSNMLHASSLSHANQRYNIARQQVVLRGRCSKLFCALHQSATGAGERKNPAVYQQIQSDQHGMEAQEGSLRLDIQHAAETRYPAQPDSSSPTHSNSNRSDNDSSSMQHQRCTKPEVLAPAGGWPQLKAAVENGADALYFGLEDFNARARAANFSSEELPTVLDYLHRRGVKGYVALNVLTFDEELPRVQQRIQVMAKAGIDAVIVQDIGVALLMKQVAPNLPVHGSTQMSITSGEGAEFARALGATRVVVGRELSVREINRLGSQTNAEVEAFVHGALCVSYSGQCFSSEAWGGRSANRGQCAQACRLPYGLIVDGALKELGDVQYLLSPQDLMALEQISVYELDATCINTRVTSQVAVVSALSSSTVTTFRLNMVRGGRACNRVTVVQVPALMEAGVHCFKIEGRLKGPDYVAVTTQAYRRAVDAVWETMQLERSALATDSSTGTSSSALSLPAYSPSADELAALQQTFARGQDVDYDGLTPGFLEGPRHQRLVRGRAPRHRGVLVGVLEAAGAAAGKDAVLVRAIRPIRRGDGVVFDEGTPHLAEQGGTVYDVVEGPSGQSTRGAASTGRYAAGGGPANEAGGGSRRGHQGSAAEGQLLRLVFNRGHINTAALKPDTLVWRTRDPSLDSQLRSTWDSVALAAARKLPVAVLLSGRAGTPLKLTLTAPRRAAALGVGGSHTVTVDSGEVQLSSADARPLTRGSLASTLGATLGTDTLKLSSLDCEDLDLGAGLFFPAKALKQLRRQAVEQLQEAVLSSRTGEGLRLDEGVLHSLLQQIRQRNKDQPTLADASASAGIGSDQPARLSTATCSGPEQGTRPSSGTAKLRVLCRSEAQVDAALQLPWCLELVLDFLEVHGLKEAAVRVKEEGRRCVIATPRILKPDEQRLWALYLRMQPDALLVRSAGMLQALLDLGGPGVIVPSLGPGIRVPLLEGDFSLNASNSITADYLLTHGRLQKLAPTHDCNAQQIAAIAKTLGSSAAAQQLEVIIHHHLPIFHTEHCVFARFLSDGDSYKDCGHPCEKHTVHLRDENTQDHLVLADMGCRNTVFNAQAQSGLYHVTNLMLAGIRHFRVELVDETPELVGPLLQCYRDVLDGKQSIKDAWAFLGTLPGPNGTARGVSGGSLDVRVERAASSFRPAGTAAASRHA